AKAAAGSPARANPWNNRSTSKIRKESIIGNTRKGTTEPAKENLINSVRPYRSERKPSTINPMINPIIVSDNAKLDSETDTLNSSTKTGRSGCTAYIQAKIKNDASAKHKVIFQK